MPTLTIDNLSPEFHAKLQQVAQQQHRSLAQQALILLEQNLPEKTLQPKQSIDEVNELKTGLKNRLITIRKKTGLTPAQLAEQTDISLSRLEQLERGELDPFQAVTEMNKLARALKVSSLWLVYGDLPVTDDPERIARVNAVSGKYAFVNTSSEQFAERKRREYELDD